MRDLTAIDDVFAPGAVVHMTGFDAPAVRSVVDVRVVEFW